MTDRKLNKEELKELLNFIERRGFKYVDVQLEILDHFACKVEDILCAEPDTPLPKAMEKAHSSFGIFGFSTIEDAYAGGLNRRFFKDMPGEWLTTIKSYKGGITSAIVVAYALMVIFSNNPDFMDGSRLGIASACLTAVVVSLIRYRPLSKNYLIYRTTASMFAVLLSIMLQLLANPGLWGLVNETWTKILTLAFLCIFGSFFMLMESKLKKVVDRVDEMELQTRYS